MNKALCKQGIAVYKELWKGLCCSMVHECSCHTLFLGLVCECPRKVWYKVSMPSVLRRAGLLLRCSQRTDVLVLAMRCCSGPLLDFLCVFEKNEFHLLTFLTVGPLKTSAQPGVWSDYDSSVV